MRQFALAGLHNPFSLAFLDETRIAVLATDGSGLAAQAFVYDITVPPSDAGEALPVGDIFPLVAPWNSGFTNDRGVPPHYPVFALAPAAPGAPRPPEASACARSSASRLPPGPARAG